MPTITDKQFSDQDSSQVPDRAAGVRSGESPAPPANGMPRRRWLVVGGLATLAGLVLLQLDGTAVEAVGAALLGAVLVAAIALIVVRLGPQSQPDRQREALARDQFDRTGDWPAD
jgi:hypothetical protein